MSKPVTHIFVETIVAAQQVLIIVILEKFVIIQYTVVAHLCR